MKRLQVAQVLHETPEVRVIRGRLDDKESVIAKTFLAKGGADKLAYEKRMLELMAQAACPQVAHLIDFLVIAGRPTLITSDIGGAAVSKLTSLSTLDALHIGVQVASALVSVHSNRIAHKDINPNNIVFNPQTRAVQIIDFGIASQLRREAQVIHNLRDLEGTPQYLAPEQTGRTNYAVDHRTDLYGLGATLYALLARQLPFSDTDLGSLIYAILTRQPTLLADLNIQIPPMVSQLVARLMAKSPDERYQSARGVLVDLQRIVAAYECGNFIESFPLGEQDHDERFAIPQKLYGRTAQAALLTDTLTQCVQQKRSLLLLLSGPSGIGKSSLLQVLQPIMLRDGILYAAGKHDQLRQHVPFAALGQAFGALVRRILSEPDAVRLAWQRRLRVAVGNLGQALVDIVPLAKTLIGSQKPLAELNARETENRLLMLLQDVLRAITEHHPLVLFLDDLQWADSGTFKLIEILAQQQASNNGLLIIGAYRDIGVDLNHQLSIFIERLAGKNITPSHVIVDSLSIDDVINFVVDATKSTPHIARPLAEHLWHKCQGNPFFLQELLKHLDDVGVLRYEPAGQCFTWTMAEVENAGLPNGVLQLVSQKLCTLSDEDRYMLCCAACIGDSFTLNLMSIASQQSRSDCYSKLQAALQAGFIVPITNSYRYALDAERDAGFRFGHDRLREAAYALLSPDSATTIHRRLGLHLWRQFQEGTHEDFFALLNHLNRSLNKITDNDERKKIAELNLRGASEARKSAASTAAREHLIIAQNLYGSDLSTTDSSTYYFLELEISMCDLIEGKMEAAFQRLSKLASIQPTGIDKARTYALRAHVCYSQRNYRDTVDDALRALACLGIPANLKSYGAILFYWIRFTRSLSRHTPQTLVALPICRSENGQFALQILSTNLVSFRWYSIATFINGCCFAVHLSLTYGKTPILDEMLAAAAALSRFLGAHKTSTKLFKAAKEIIGDREATAGITRTIIETSLGSTNLDALASAEQTGIDHHNARRNGNLVNACMAGGASLIALFYSNLLTYFDQRDQFLQTIRSSGLEGFKSLEDLRYSAARRLSGASESLELDISANAASEMVSKHGLGNETCDALLILTLTHWVLDNDGLAYNIFLKICNPTTWFTILPLTLALFAFYGIIIFRDRMRRGFHLPFSYRRLLIKMEKYVYRAAHPQYFASVGAGEQYFVSAEHALAHRKEEKATLLYVKACEAITSSTWTPHQALIHERVARYFIKKGNRHLGVHYLRWAVTYYKRWGATVKSERLEHELFNSFKGESAKREVDATYQTLQTTNQLATANLDFNAFVRSASIISQQTTPSKVAEQVLETIKHISGATRALLVTWEGHDGHDTVVQADTAPGRGLPIELFSIIRRQQQIILLGHIEADVVTDPYFSVLHIKSLLAIPLLQQAALLGLVYLEHDKLENAFSPHRVQIFQVLAMQAILVLTNAHHKEKFEEEIAVRTEQLKSAYTQLVVMERDKTETQMAGGFAHEMRNALSGARMPLGVLVPVETKQQGQTIMEDITTKLQSVQQILQNIKGFNEIDSTINLALDSIRQDVAFIVDLMHSVASGLERALLITKNILNYAQVGSQVGSDGTTNALKLLNSIFLEFANSWQAHNIQSYIECSDTELDLPVKEDHAYVILRNLLINATESLADKREGRREIRVAIGRHAGQVSVSVADSGIGMSRNTQEKIFQPFFTTKGAHGIGLGLGLSRKLARLYGGDLNFKSSEEVGTSFYLTLPYRHDLR